MDEGDAQATCSWDIHDPRDVEIDKGLLGVAVLDARGRLVALYPALDDGPTIPEITFRERVAPDDEFELLASDLRMPLGARRTFDQAYDPTEPHTFLVLSRYGMLSIRSLKVNSPALPDGERLLESNEIQLEPDAPANGSVVHVHPDCLVRGAYRGTVSYDEGTLTLRAASSTDGVPLAGEPYEITLFISDIAEPCQ